jgi:hypothetical protein
MAVQTDLISIRERLGDLCFDFEPDRDFLRGGILRWSWSPGPSMTRLPSMNRGWMQGRVLLWEEERLQTDPPEWEALQVLLDVSPSDSPMLERQLMQGRKVSTCV